MQKADFVNSSLPSKLYKYCKFDERVLPLLLRHEVWFSRPIDFNDPLECRPVLRFDIADIQVEELYWALYHGARTPPELSSPDEVEHRVLVAIEDGSTRSRHTLRRALMELDIQSAIENEVSTRGIYCLSSNCTSGLMWSHYADSHRGLCVQFDTTAYHPPGMQEVTYDQPRWLDASLLWDWKMRGSETAGNQLLGHFLYRKARNWKYEEEWRVVRSAPGCQSSSMQVRGVIFGERTPVEVVCAVILLLRVHRIRNLVTGTIRNMVTGTVPAAKS